MKFILLINVKMPTIVGILTFISMINTTSERFKAWNFFICRYFTFYEQLKFHAQLSWAWKKLLTSGPGHTSRTGLPMRWLMFDFPKNETAPQSEKRILPSIYHIWPHKRTCSFKHTLSTLRFLNTIQTSDF